MAFLGSCSPSNIEDNALNEPEIALDGEAIQEIQEEAEAIREERNQKGDTLALNDSILRSYLPREIAEFKPEGAFVGTPYGMSGTSYANAEQTYTNGKAHIRVTLDDYNGKESRLAQHVALWNQSPRRETPYMISGKFTFAPGMIGWEVYSRKKRKAELMIAVSDRVLLSIVADQQESTDFIKFIAKRMNLEELATFWRKKEGRPTQKAKKTLCF